MLSIAYVYIDCCLCRYASWPPSILLHSNKFINRPKLEFTKSRHEHMIHTFRRHQYKFCEQNPDSSAILAEMSTLFRELFQRIGNIVDGTTILNSEPIQSLWRLINTFLEMAEEPDYWIEVKNNNHSLMDRVMEFELENASSNYRDMHTPSPFQVYRGYESEAGVFFMGHCLTSPATPSLPSLPSPAPPQSRSRSRWC